MNRGLVSIIIPVYNRAVFLEDCLDSVREQTWKELEVIVVDDGSTDRSREIIQKYGKLDSRFRLLTISHQGPSAARNKGIEAATGEFLTFVDADDYVERNYIGNMVAAIGDADICIAGYKAWYQDRNIWQTFKPAAGRFTLAEFGKAISRYECMLGGVAWKLLRRSVVSEHGLVFPQELRFAEDMIFYLQYLSQIKTIVVISDTQYVYRQHHQQSQVKAALCKKETLEQFYAELEKLYKQIQHEDLRYLITYWQVLNTWEMARYVCYKTRGYQKRKKQFYEIARQRDLKRKCRRVRHGSVTATAVKLTVLSNTFLPMNLFLRAAGRIKH